jgi:hypothetical protein
VRGRLADELGIDPGTELCRLHEAIIRADPTIEKVRRPRPTGHPVPAQLPANVGDFTGRAAQLAQLDQVMPGPGQRGTNTVGVVAISGTAGIGKTALAVRWAHQVRDCYPDGQLYVNLRGYAPTRPVTPVEALTGFLYALGVPVDRIPVELEPAAALYRTLLADKRVLVVLDNARSVERVRPLLPGGTGCLVLVTSRDQLGGLVARDGARRIRLDVLAATEAHALLAQLLGAERVATEPAAVTELARLCEPAHPSRCSHRRPRRRTRHR